MLTVLLHWGSRTAQVEGAPELRSSCLSRALVQRHACQLLVGRDGIIEAEVCGAGEGMERRVNDASTLDEDAGQALTGGVCNGLILAVILGSLEKRGHGFIRAQFPETEGSMRPISRGHGFVT